MVVAYASTRVAGKEVRTAGRRQWDRSWQTLLGLNFDTHHQTTWKILTVHTKKVHSHIFILLGARLHSLIASSPITHHITHYYHKLWMKLIVSARSTRGITLSVPVRSSALVDLALHWPLPTRALHVVSLSFTVSFRPKSQSSHLHRLPEERLPCLKHGTRTD